MFNAIFQTLISLGVSLAPANSPEAICPPGWGASYHFGQNKISLCTTRPGLAQIAFKHEVIHVAQDCKAGLHNSNFSVLFPQLNPFTNSSVPHNELSLGIMQEYPRRFWAVEYEAFIMQNFQVGDLSKVLRRFCS